MFERQISFCRKLLATRRVIKDALNIAYLQMVDRESSGIQVENDDVKLFVEFDMEQSNRDRSIPENKRFPAEASKKIVESSGGPGILLKFE